MGLNTEKITLLNTLYAWFDFRAVYLGKFKRGNYYPIFSVHVFNARKIENGLHIRFRAKNARPSDRATKIGIARDTKQRWKQIGKDDDGHTEWFNLSPSDVLTIRAYLLILSIKAWFQIIIGLSLFLIIFSLGVERFIVLFGHHVLSKLIILCGF